MKFEEMLGILREMKAAKGDKHYIGTLRLKIAQITNAGDTPTLNRAIKSMVNLELITIADNYVYINSVVDEL